MTTKPYLHNSKFTLTFKKKKKKVKILPLPQCSFPHGVDFSSDLTQTASLPSPPFPQPSPPHDKVFSAYLTNLDPLSPSVLTYTCGFLDWPDPPCILPFFQLSPSHNQAFSADLTHLDPPSPSVLTYILRVPDQNGVSQAWHTAEIHHSGGKPLIWFFFFFFFLADLAHPAAPSPPSLRYTRMLLGR